MVFGQAVERLYSATGRLLPAGLDLGGQAVKFCQIMRKRDNIVVYRVLVRSLPRGTVSGGIVKNRELLLGVLSELYREYPACGGVVIAAPGGEVILRNFELPKMPESELGEAVRWEAAEDLPLPLDEMVLDYELMAENGQEGTCEVRVAAVKRELIASVLDVIEEAGFHPIAVDPEPLAIERSLLKVLPGDLHASRVVCVLEIGATSSELIFIDQGRVIFFRTLHQGGVDLTEKLAERLGISFQEAEDLKCSGELEDPALLEDAAEGLITEVEDTISYFRSYHLRRLDKLILLGGGGRIYHLPELFTDRLRLPVIRGNLLENVEISKDGVEPEILGHLSMSLGVSLGLALKGEED